MKAVARSLAALAGNGYAAVIKTRTDIMGWSLSKAINDLLTSIGEQVKLIIPLSH